MKFQNQAEQTMLKTLSDNIIAIIAGIAFLVLTVYLLVQDTSLVGPF
jgi:hypothetical protein